MAVHTKNQSFAEEQRQRIAESVQNSSTIANNTVTTSETPTEKTEIHNNIVTTLSSEGNSKKKDVLIGIHVTKEEQAELRQVFCSNGFSLATAYRAAMTYLRQDILDGKAYITGNGEILRK